jgi:hypothetical protein
MKNNKFIPANYLTNEEKNQILFFKNKIKNSTSRTEIDNYNKAIARIYADMIIKIKMKNQKSNTEKINFEKQSLYNVGNRTYV